MPLDDNKVLVAMSGGVDSSLAAALLAERGMDVTGVFLRMHPPESGRMGCSSPADADDARRVADRLGFELLILDTGDAFEPIVQRFVAEYARGRTPNPCLLCNPWIKYGKILELADRRGARWMATGHYARVAHHDGRPAVFRGASLAKDQSYVLFGLSLEQLERVMLPIGELPDKQQTRAFARQRGLEVHDKPDSQDICFAGGEDYTAVLARHVPEALAAGEIVNAAGDVLGRHDGYARYTIGQRKGLGVAAGVPMYVTRIDPASAQVTIGPRDEVLSTALEASAACWHADVPLVGDWMEVNVQVRYNHRGQPGRMRRTAPDAFLVEFHEPVLAVTPGQAAVLYEGDRLLGGGWIDRGSLQDHHHRTS